MYVKSLYLLHLKISRLPDVLLVVLDFPLSREVSYDSVYFAPWPQAQP